jgi:hypothetical protein
MHDDRARGMRQRRNLAMDSKRISRIRAKLQKAGAVTRIGEVLQHYGWNQRQAESSKILAMTRNRKGGST